MYACLRFLEVMAHVDEARHANSASPPKALISMANRWSDQFNLRSRMTPRYVSGGLFRITAGTLPFNLAVKILPIRCILVRQLRSPFGHQCGHAVASYIASPPGLVGLGLPNRGLPQGTKQDDGPIGFGNCIIAFAPLSKD